MTYQVNRSTVVRWLSQARHTLLKETERLLREHIALDGAEFSSVMRLVQSLLDLSLTRVFHSQRGAESKRGSTPRM